ncbi:mycofactocin-coupled SDR family oxidoreductase [Streptomyces sp. NPDC057257]|uniref:mycofactocin-coupled SDR family oxidoreductase n=1 Tax=Streptomyces sp. NPDC057257 TaxID=3346071 RepID=UPI00362B7947
MPGRVEGKVAFITGAARGQGRSHAARLAEEGADIIAVDILEDVPTAAYPMATKEDMDETVRLVEAHGRRILPIKADVRDPGQMRDAAAAGMAAFGHIDVLVANAGILSFDKTDFAAFTEVFGVDFLGVVNSVDAVAPHLQDGASLILTASTAAMLDGTTDRIGPGGMGYTSAKRAVARYAHDIARLFTARRIRVNVIHPFNTNTTLIQNDLMYKTFRPDLENPTQEDAIPAFASTSPMNVPWVEPLDISNAVLFLASDESRYITGMQLRVDTGQMLPTTTAGVAG